VGTNDPLGHDSSVFSFDVHDRETPDCIYQILNHCVIGGSADAEPCAGKGKGELCYVYHFLFTTPTMSRSNARLEPEVIVNVRGPDHRRLSVN